MGKIFTNENEFNWDSDWFEGQNFIEVYKIITEKDILSAFKDGEMI